MSVFDVVGAPGVAADLSHIDTPAKVTGHGMTLKQFKGEGEPIADKDAFQAAAFAEALKGADVVVIPAGVPRKPGMTRQDLFEVNAKLNANFADAVAKHCPKAFVAIISNPVNSTVPIFAEQMKKHGCVSCLQGFSYFVCFQNPSLPLPPNTPCLVYNSSFLVDVQGYTIPAKCSA